MLRFVLRTLTTPLDQLPRRTEVQRAIVDHLPAGRPRLATPAPNYLARVYTGSIVAGVSVPITLLGLLEPEASHGYELKREYDTLFADNGRPLSFGQLYTTLARLERDGQIAVCGSEPGGGPDRKRYAITPTGVTRLERWLGEPERPEPMLQAVLFVKVVLALLSNRPAARYLDAQRVAHLERMRELTAMRRPAR